MITSLLPGGTDPTVLNFSGQVVTVGSLMMLVTQFVKLSPDFLKIVTPGNRLYVRLFLTLGVVAIHVVWAYLGGKGTALETVIGSGLSVAIATWQYEWLFKESPQKS